MNILICEDHKIYRDGICLALEKADGFNKVFEAGDGRQALEVLKKNTIDLVLMDISMPGKSGLQILQTIAIKWPAVKVLILSQYTEPQYARNALTLGASGYLSKDVEPKELIATIRKVMQGKLCFADDILESLHSTHRKDKRKTLHNILSDLEFRIMIEIAKDRKLVEIAKEMGCSPKTISSHKGHIMNKMEFKSFLDLRCYCLAHKYIVSTDHDN